MDNRKQNRTDAKREKLRQRAAERAAERSADPAGDGGQDANKNNNTNTTNRSIVRSKHSSRDKSGGSGWKWKLIALVLFLLVVGLAYSGWNMKQYMSRFTEIRLTDEGFVHNDRFEKCAVIDGIDISEYQKEGFKWEKAKTSGVDFVFIRAGYRTVDSGTIKADPKFAANARAAADAGIMVGAYIYSQALTPEEAEEEADFLLEQVAGYDITMPLVIDYELYTDGRLYNKIQAGEMPLASDYHNVVKAFCRKVEAAGYESAIYANLDMLSHYMDAQVLCKEENVWLARFNRKAELDADYRYWQCTEAGMVAGYGGNVDHDFWYVEPGRVYTTRAAGKGKDKNRTSIGDCRVNFHKDTCRLKRLRAIPKLSMTCDGKNMRRDKDYVVSFVENTEPGTGYAIIRGIGIYKDWIAVPFKIE